MSTSEQDPAWALTNDQLRELVEARGYQMVRWEGIETADDNESLIVIQQPSPIAWAMYRHEDTWFLNGDGEEMQISPTHWLSGLKPPADSAKG